MTSTLNSAQRRVSLAAGLSLLNAAIAIPFTVALGLWSHKPLFSGRQLLAAAAVTVFYAVVERLAVRISIGKANLNYVASEFGLLAGLVFVHPVAHVLARFVGFGLGTIWRTFKTPRVPTFSLAILNGFVGAAEVALFSMVFQVFGWPRSLTVKTGGVLLIAWAVNAVVFQCVLSLSRRLVGERNDFRRIRASIADVVTLSLATTGLAAVMVFSYSVVVVVVLGLVIAVGTIAAHRMIGLLVQGDQFRAIDEFFALLQSSDASNVEAALQLASEATKHRRVQLVIVERAGIDHSLDSALMISPGDRTTCPVADLPTSWRLALVSEPGPRTGGDQTVCPLIVSGRRVGLLVCSERYDESPRGRDTTVGTVLRLAQHLSLWLEQDRLLTELRRDIADRSRRSLHDSLTGLLNRRGLSESWEHIDTANGVVMFLIDLDGFKEVNSFVGHDGGDQLLMEAANRLRQVLPDRAHIARIGGDEFAACVPGIRRGHELTDAGDFGVRIRSALSGEFTIDGHIVTLGASVGVAVLPHHGLDVATLLRHADVALFNAKDDPESGVAVFADALYGHDVQRIDGYRLKAAIDDNDIEVHFQPIVDMETSRVTGFEALARWNDHGTYVMPAQFIGLAEKTGHVHALTERVMLEAFAQLVRWRESTGRDLHIGINVSPMSISHPDVHRALSMALQRTKLDPAAVFLEVTESRMFRDPLRATAQLNRLREAGVKVSLDDFGTGASTHDWLVRMAPDALKIDRSFVASMFDEPLAAGVIEVDVLLGRKFGMTVIAEGVETVTQWNELKRLGVSQAQGYLLGRPKPPAGIVDWLAHEEPRLAELIALAGSLDPASQE